MENRKSNIYSSKNSNHIVYKYYYMPDGSLVKSDLKKNKYKGRPKSLLTSNLKK